MSSTGVTYVRAEPAPRGPTGALCLGLLISEDECEGHDTPGHGLVFTECQGHCLSLLRCTVASAPPLAGSPGLHPP